MRRRIRDGIFGRSFDVRFLRAIAACSRESTAFLHNRHVRRPAIALAAVAFLVASTGAWSQPDRLESFQTPSRNIACGYLSGPDYLRCDIRSGLRPEPRRACELDWTGLSMGAGGRAGATCAGDTVADPRARVLAYGRAWARDGFTCLSARIGLMCTNRVGHGFFLSKERWQVS